VPFNTGQTPTNTANPLARIGKNPMKNAYASAGLAGGLGEQMTGSLFLTPGHPATLAAPHHSKLAIYGGQRAWTEDPSPPCVS